MTNSRSEEKKKKEKKKIHGNLSRQKGFKKKRTG